MDDARYLNPPMSLEDMENYFATVKGGPEAWPTLKSFLEIMEPKDFFQFSHDLTMHIMKGEGQE